MIRRHSSSSIRRAIILFGLKQASRHVQLLKPIVSMLSKGHHLDNLHECNILEPSQRLLFTMCACDFNPLFYTKGGVQGVVYRT